LFFGEERRHEEIYLCLYLKLRKGSFSEQSVHLKHMRVCARVCAHEFVRACALCVCVCVCVCVRVNI
jgi:hypothetical protein